MSRLAEDVVSAIETAYSQRVIQGDTDSDLALLACAVLFRGYNTLHLYDQHVREHVPWPFLPEWEYSPWVFDEILASIRFTLKKHTHLHLSDEQRVHKKCADKLHDFFGCVDPGSGDRQASSAIGAGAAQADSADVRSTSVVSSIPLGSVRSASLAPSDTLLMSELRNILVRCRRKLKVLLGEQVEESIISVSRPSAQPIERRAGEGTSEEMGGFSLSVLDESAYSLLTPEYTSQTSSGTMSSTNPDDLARGIAPDVRQYSKIRDVLGDTAPAPSLYDHQLQQKSTVEDDEDVSHEQCSRACWRHNKLTNMLGGLPTNITTLYATDSRLPLSSSEAPSDVDDCNTTKGLLGRHSVKGQQRLRAKKL
ncbi:hypothetical protein H4R20_003943 [Coemansia guatemalensis]|uniref:Uncharacterized protein n=1 Tax=Coemansia guatemalensis TaxID=2761395 RepID=A0A9W8HYK6_9FUNG|nr:hypothetical protein H4R20_003943 [Coemansia guatemalensis]